jgi:hypothetical protein
MGDADRPGTGQGPHSAGGRLRCFLPLFVCPAPHACGNISRPSAVPTASACSHDFTRIEGITWPTSSSRRSASAEKQGDEARKTATFLTSRIDKAAAKGILHKNNAAHKKSRVAHTLAQLA